MASGHNQKSQIDYSISFEDVSKLFSLPLSEAADILGVSTSVLKKICNDNGLERWPHRKYLAGKSIEDIKKEAAKEKNKALGGTPPKSPAFHVNDKSPEPYPDMSKSQEQLLRAAASNLAIESDVFSDEFKYGFPSDGLSEYTYRWWGSSVDSNDGSSNSDQKTSSEPENTCKAKEDSISTFSEDKIEKMEEVSESDKQDGISLLVIRKRAVEEGKKSFKLRVLKNYGADNLGNEEKVLLRKLYQTG